MTTNDILETLAASAGILILTAWNFKALAKLLTWIRKALKAFRKLRKEVKKK